MKFLQLIALLFIGSCTSFTLNAQTKNTLAFRVLDEKGQTLNFTTATLYPWEISAVANNSGIIYLNVPSFQEKVVVNFSHVGKERKNITVEAAWAGTIRNIVLKNNDLSLEQVQVTATQSANKNSNSSIIFDRTAIEQTQAVSVSEILNYLPGQTILKSSVAIQSYNPLMLRSGITAASGVSREFIMNNTFGTAVIVDGVNWNNGADMQSLNIAKNGFGANIRHWNNAFDDRTVQNGSIYNQYTAALSHDGFDFRSLSTENIEKIEVIQGVASARYGDYTSGVVNIVRQAGNSALRARINNTSGLLNTSLSKGFNLGSNAGALNVSLNYLNGHDDPRNSRKTMERINAGVMWTIKSSRANGIRNTLSLDYMDSRDQGRVDADDPSDRASAFINKSIRISNRFAKDLNTALIKSIELNTSVSIGQQESFDQYYLNSSFKKIAYAMETGVSEGEIMPGYYLAYRRILGEPVNLNATLNMHTTVSDRSFYYRINYGLNYSYSANKGKGIVIDQDKPRFQSEEGVNDRPTNFRILPAMVTYGAYVENQFRTDIWGKTLNANFGLRGDWQNGYINAAPRLSANYEILPKLRFNASWGLSYKTPSMSQIYPGNIYYDIPILELTGATANEYLYLVYTQVIEQNNKDNLKPYSSRSYELGLSYEHAYASIGVNYFDRVSENGFGSVSNLLLLDVPLYDYSVNPGSKPTYWANGDTKYIYKTYTTLGNGVYNHSKGMDIMINTKKIKAILTSFNLTTAWYESYYKNNLPRIVTPEANNFDENRKALYAAFLSSESKSVNVKSTLSSITHIPKLKMAFTFTGEIFWKNYTESPLEDKFPDGYYDRSGNFYPLTKNEAQSPEYQHLWKANNTLQTRVHNPDMVYYNIHMRLSKDIGEVLRLSFNAYNIFNIRPLYVDPNTRIVRYYNGQPSFSLDLQLTIK
ncbi:TonB-dependent receptor plug domain-containing protein [Gynurincola endophyticus]|uniref:TonB-dependent receptor plug domain-containing protein n=1 Tax=Gynurincola endophyticus TaxID=2479004 RepID=UPI000F8CA7E2|nr:TonB-dependent receptor [Gynurincola endophyticus]